MASYPFQTGQVDQYDPTIPRTDWDVVTLGQFTLPGINTVAISRARKGVVKSPKDKSYATIKDSGLELAKIMITNVCAYESQLEKLETVLKYFDSQLGVKVVTKNKSGDGDSLTGFPIEHPLLQLRGVSSVYIEDIEGPHVSRPGFITTIFKCIEVRNVKATKTLQVNPGASFAEGSAFSAPQQAPTPPSATAAVTGPKKL